MTSERTKEHQNAWALQLIQEFEAINWQYNLRLKTPCIEITASISQAGSWHAGSKTLKIACWLLIDHDWPVVLLVLKHEMAHQYVSEIMKAGNVAPHGEAFQVACDRLGLLNPAFRSSSAHIPQIVRKPTAAVSGLQLKIAKLFALAESGNENEAKLALKKGNELLRKYNVDRLNSIDSSQYDSVSINYRKKKIEAHQRLLAGILNDFYFVNVTISQIFDQHALETYRTIELTGERENLAIAEYVYHFVDKKLTSFWEKYRCDYGAAGKEKRSFFLGVLQGFRDKLAREEEQHVSMQECPTSSLIHLSDPGLLKYYKARYPRVRQVRRKGAKVYRDSFISGKEKGERLIVHRGISMKNDTDAKKFLE
jgi:predicted SprT family Zn-dependent metalloprotease